MASSNASPAVAWSTARFSETIESLNAAVQQGKVQRDQSVLARKSLAETTKQFKRSVKVAETASSNLATSTSTTSSSAEQDSVLSAVEALSKECRVTIKAYQEEVDNLTRRCKGSEQACTTVLTALLGLPDPAPLLLVQQQQTLQDEQQHKQVIHALEQELERSRRENLDQQQQYQKLLQKEAKEQSNAPTDTSMSNSEREELSALRKEVAEYEIEFRSLKNQDITIRKLEDRIFELQTAGEESIRHAIDQARSELAYTEGRRAQEALEREAATEAKLQTLELQLRSERAGREATQNAMISADNAVNHQQAAWEAQRQILVDDNERVREALETLKLERDGLTNNANYNNNTNNAMTNYASNSAFLKPANAPISGGTTTSALPMSGNSGGIAAFQDLLLERNAYEAEVQCFRYCFVSVDGPRFLFDCLTRSLGFSSEPSNHASVRHILTFVLSVCRFRNYRTRMQC